MLYSVVSYRLGDGSIVPYGTISISLPIATDFASSNLQPVRCTCTAVQSAVSAGATQERNNSNSSNQCCQHLCRPVQTVDSIELIYSILLQYLQLVSWSVGQLVSWSVGQLVSWWFVL